MGTINQILESFLHEEKLPPTSPGKRILSRVYPDIDKITRAVGHFIHVAEAKNENRKGGVLTIDITSTIPSEYNDKKKKVFVKLSDIEKTKKQGRNDVNTADNGDVILTLSWPGTFHFSWTVGYGNTYSAFTTLKHEIVHILDYCQLSEKKMIRNHMLKGDPNFLKSSISYYSNAYEFNQIINAIKEYSRLHPNSWKKITDFNKIYDIIAKHGNGYVDVDDELRNSSAFRTKLKKRLEKDGLIPTMINQGMKK